MCLHFIALSGKTEHGQSSCWTVTSGMSLSSGESEPALLSVGAVNPKGHAGITFFQDQDLIVRSWVGFDDLKVLFQPDDSLTFGRTSNEVCGGWTR